MMMKFPFPVVMSILAQETKRKKEEDIQHMGVSKHRGTPKWIVIRETPIKMDDLGAHPYFRKQPYYKPLLLGADKWQMKLIYLIPGSSKCVKSVPFHPKNLPKGRNFTYMEDPGILGIFIYI